MTAPAALLLFTRLMEHLAVWKSTGVFIAVIRMVIAGTASWSVLFILFEVCVCALIVRVGIHVRVRVRVRVKV